MQNAYGRISFRIGNTEVGWNTTIMADAGKVLQPFTTLATPVADWLPGAGTGTLPTGHNLTAGTYDVYWAGGYRYGMTAAITDDVITLTDGSEAGGTALPVADTPLTVGKQVAVVTDFDYNNVSLLIAAAAGRCLLLLKNDQGEIMPAELTSERGLLVTDAFNLREVLTYPHIVTATVSTGETVVRDRVNGVDGVEITIGMTYDCTP